MAAVWACLIVLAAGALVWSPVASWGQDARVERGKEVYRAQRCGDAALPRETVLGETARGAGAGVVRSPVSLEQFRDGGARRDAAGDHRPVGARAPHRVRNDPARVIATLTDLDLRPEWMDRLAPTA